MTQDQNVSFLNIYNRTRISFNCFIYRCESSHVRFHTFSLLLQVHFTHSNCYRCLASASNPTLLSRFQMQNAMEQDYIVIIMPLYIYKRRILNMPRSSQTSEKSGNSPQYHYWRACLGNKWMVISVVATKSFLIFLDSVSMSISISLNVPINMNKRSIHSEGN